MVGILHDLADIESLEHKDADVQRYFGFERQPYFIVELFPFNNDACALLQLRKDAEAYRYRFENLQFKAGELMIGFTDPGSTGDVLTVFPFTCFRLVAGTRLEIRHDYRPPGQC